MTATASTCECGGGSSVEETRETGGGRVRRRRMCMVCGTRWRTYETRHADRSILDVAADDADQMMVDVARMVTLATKGNPMSSDRTSPTFTPCPECRIVGAHRFDCSRNPRTRAATPEQLQAASRPPGVPPDASPRGEPPEHVVEAARLAGTLSPCGKSKRGAAIFDPATGNVTSRGCNHLPARIACAGDDACRAACNRRCIHAETAAIVDAHQPSVPGCEIVHVKVVDGVVVASGPPSCVPCAAMILRARLDAAWLLHEDGWRRYPADEFYRLSCEAPPKVPTPPIASPALTVGSALLDPRFKPREVVVEYREIFPPSDADEEPVVGEIFQLRSVIEDGITYAERRQWYAAGSRWFRWKDSNVGSCGVNSVDCLALPACLVVAAEMDNPPDSRAPLASPPAEAEREGPDFARLAEDFHDDLAARSAGKDGKRTLYRDLDESTRRRWHASMADTLSRAGLIGSAPTPTRAIAAPGLDLASRAAALLAVADRATPGPWSTRKVEHRGGENGDGEVELEEWRVLASSGDVLAMCCYFNGDSDELNARAIATLRDAPGIICEQQAEIERLRVLAAEACSYAEQACAWWDDEAPPPPSGPNLIIRRIAAIRAALASKEPTP